MQRRKTNLILAAILIILLGLAFLSIDLYSSYQKSKEEKENLANFFDNFSLNVDRINNLKKLNPQNNSSNSQITSYIAVLEIPKINIKQGLVKQNSSLNDVNKNIEILNGYMPDHQNSNLILSSHSGTSPVSYFNDLHLLNQNDKIFIYYNHHKYRYKVIKKYEIPKNGKLRVPFYPNETLLTLTTCSTTSNNQLVVIAKQIS